MATYQNCTVGEAARTNLEVGEAGYGYGFNILSEKRRPLVTLAFATQEEAEQARAEVARAVAKTVEITPHG